MQVEKGPVEVKQISESTLVARSPPVKLTFENLEFEVNVLLNK